MNAIKNDINENEKNESDDLLNQNIKQPSDIAETVVSILVDKIISEAVLTCKVNQIYKGMNSYCFDYLTNFINPYLESYFIFYENDKNDPSYQNNQIYFSSKPLEKLNSWDIIPEPKTNEKDRYSNSNTKIIKYKKYTEVEEGVKEASFALDAEEDIKFIKNNDIVFNESIDLQDDKNKEKDKINERNIKENKENKDINKKEIKVSHMQSTKNVLDVKTKEENKKIKINKKKALIDKYLEDLAPKKKEKEEVLEISITDDLPKESYENIYSIINSNDENTKLRREREIEIEQKNAQRLAEIEREKRAKQKLYRRIVKDFDSNRLTFDPNGKIINLKTMNENLVGEFISSRIKIKAEKNKKKPTMELKDIVYPIQGIDLNTIKEGKTESIAPTRRASANFKEIVNTVDSDISKIKVEKNYEVKVTNDNNNKKNKDKDKISILPSGYNFDKFIPEVGVIITGEDEREKKEGGFEYVKKYNKPSFNEMSRFISESINLNSNNFSSLMNSSNDLNANNKSIKQDENNYIGYKEEFNENNPLMQNVHRMNSNEKYSSPNLKKLHSLKIYDSNYNLRKRNLMNSYDKINTDIAQYQSIQLSKNFEENHLQLKNIFDEPNINNQNKNYLKSIDANNLQKMNYYEKAVLPFKKFMNKKKRNELKLLKKEKENQQKKSSDEALINKFNVEIINNKEWGKGEEDPVKIQQKLREEMENENKPKSNLRLPRINYNRMKNLGIQIMTEGNNIRERKLPLFGGNFK
jgi:hypothetical protein